MLLDERNLGYKLSVCKYFRSPSVHGFFISTNILQEFSWGKHQSLQFDE